MSHHRPTSFIVAFVVLVCAVISYEANVRAAEPPAETPTENEPKAAGAARSALSTRNGDPRIGSLSPRLEPEPTPLPTPVAPSEGWKGYVVQPPAPTAPPEPPPVTTMVVRRGGWPVLGPISQGFAPWHQGLDLAVPCGTTVAAIDFGQVVWSGWKNNGGGLVVDVRLDNGYLASFNHLAQSFVAPGQWVGRGGVIAAVGTSGNSTGCHLHLGIQTPNGIWVDPLGYLN